MAKVAKIMIDMLARRSDKRIDDPRIISVIRNKELSHDADIVNISRKGLRFRSNGQFYKGDKLRFDLKSVDSDAALSLSIKAKVINDYGKTNEHTFEYGVRFLRLQYWYEMNCIHDYVYSIGL